MATLPLFVLFLALQLLPHETVAIGVNYGTLGDNLPPPAQVAAFLKQRTRINRVKIFDSNPDLIRAFAGTGISVVITAPDDAITSLASPGGAAAFVAAHVTPFYPATDISLVLVGNEILDSADRNLIFNLVPAMRQLAVALAASGLGKIRVSTPHSLGILAASDPPSAGQFRRGYGRVFFKPMLELLRRTRSPFVVNPYPYFGYSPQTLAYAQFRPNPGMRDKATGLRYTNMLTAQLDAVRSAMNRLGFEDVDIVIGETGWPSKAEPGQGGVSAADAAAYNGNLVKWLRSRAGTPLMPNRTIEAYIFALFNENLKPGPIAERNFGLFYPNMTPVYNAGILRHGSGSRGRSRGGRGGRRGKKRTSSGRWCVPKAQVSNTALQNNINYACGSKLVDCKPIQNGGPCFLPNTLQAHAAYAMNAYYQASGRQAVSCDFAGTGIITTTDPGHRHCKFIS
ncbi:glucan endo-1,3-beta-glucosidase-like [Typha latifolia]|uniref:glucan endo-1,3-beta-glucosidase-like n=1 Tax=Typha latifolia TaxID=4733 RepID=UPI003C2F7CD1